MDYRTITPFVPRAELRCIIAGFFGEEGQFFRDKINEFKARIEAMPVTYAQDGLGDQATVYLHYFKDGADWWIMEKDSDPDGEGQIQAFGYADLGYGAELGYISIEELVTDGIELDLYFTPATVAELKAAGSIRT